VGDRLHDDLHHLALGLAVLNPLRSEAEAFRFLVYVVLVAAVVIGLVLLVRTL
jgi:hypothetical protein